MRFVHTLMAINEIHHKIFLSLKKVTLVDCISIGNSVSFNIKDKARGARIIFIFL